MRPPAKVPLLLALRVRVEQAASLDRQLSKALHTTCHGFNLLLDVPLTIRNLEDPSFTRTAGLVYVHSRMFVEDQNGA